MSKTFTSKQADYAITLQAEWIGNDLFLCLFGGDTPHIGTVTTFSSETEKHVQRFPSHDGRFHKDDVLAELLLKPIAAEIPGNCVITAGVHVDHISKEQIEASFSMTAELAEALKLWLLKHTLAKAPLYK
ncbi:amino acid decarboxylase [Enterococcus gilvus]|uniref:prenylated flavin chaperone LpdD n=1 Tax=Enterococcus gilvus TaxID=160453 RepID=UPI001C8B8E4D|nr:amino acid decarboxylase [Enterococcus gilvus]MBX8938129.1 extensin family protein [Enterococcus gilvus]